MWHPNKQCSSFEDVHACGHEKLEDIMFYMKLELLGS